MSSTAVDRVGDIVEVKGIALTSFRKNPIALWNHQSDSPIGTWSELRKEADRLVGKLQLAAEGTSPLIDRLRKLIEQRILRAVSIGFRALAADPLDPEDPWGGLRFTKSELLECSVVSVPANDEALRIRGLRPDPADTQIFLPPPASPRPSAAGAGSAGRQRASAPPNPTSGGRAMPRSIAERIVAHQQRAAAVDAEITTINDAAANDDDRDFTTDENDRIAVLSEEKRIAVNAIDTLTGMEAALAAKAVPFGQAQGYPRAHAQVATKEAPGTMIAKMATVAALAFLQQKNPADVIAERYRDDERVKDCWDYTTRSAVQIADTLTPGWAKELVATDVAAFIDDLAHVSVFAALRSRPAAPSVTFDGAGSITMPRRTQGSLGGSWVGEAGVIPVLQGIIAAIALTPTKLAAITTFTRELQSGSNNQIENILRNGLRDDTANVLDIALLSANAAIANVRPAGILLGVAGVPSSGDTPEAIRADIAAAVGPIIAAGGGRDIVLIVNPMAALSVNSSTTLNGNPAFPETSQGQLMTYSLIQSLNVPAGNLIAVDAADFANGAGVPEYRVSEEATLVMASADATPPQMNVDAAGVATGAGTVPVDGGIHVAGGPATAATAGAQAMSMYQQYAIALRLVMPVHWAMRRPGMVGLVTGFPDTTP
jgi:HK97 family phage prohead protease/HK97 family phage major capsid protein